MITPEDLHRFAPLCDDSVLAPIFSAQLPVGQIDTPLRIAHFLAQTAEETGGFTVFVENLDYSAAALLRVWPAHFNTVNCAAYARKPEAIANRAYGGRMGNGDEASGDGWTYRGRGLLQLTGRANYALMASWTGLDLINHPELLQEPGPAVQSAVAFWTHHGLNTYADKDDITAITRIVNGGLINLAARQSYLARAKSIWVDRPAAPVAPAPVSVAVSPPLALEPRPPKVGAVAPDATAPHPEGPMTDFTPTPVELPSQVTAFLSLAATHAATALAGALVTAGALQSNQTNEFVTISAGLLVYAAGQGIAWLVQHLRHKQAQGALAQAKAS